MSETSSDGDRNSDSELPQGRVWSYLEDCVTILDNKRIPINSDDREKLVGDVPYYGATGQVGWINDFIFDEELLLLGEDGAPFLESNKNKAYIIKGKSWVNNHAHVLRALQEITSNYYLFHYLNVFNYHGYVSGTTRYKLNQASMRKIPVPLPPLTEQHRIVTKIEELFTQLDAGVTSLKKVQAQLKRYRQAVLKVAFEGELTRDWREEHLDKNFKSFTNIPTRSNNIWEKSRKGRLWGSGSVPELPERFKKSIPSAWKWDKLKNFGNGIDETVQVGPMSMQTKDLTDSGVPVLTIGSVQWGSFNEDKMNFMPVDIATKFKRYSLQKDDIIFTRSGTIGRSAVVTQKQTGYIISFNLLRVRTDPKKCIPQYLFYVFCGAPHIKWETEQASIGTTRSCVSTRILENLDIPLTTIPEQEKIIEMIDHYFSIINHLENTIETCLRQAETLRQSILKRAFEGKLVPQDPNDELASILLERIKAEKARYAVEVKKGKTLQPNSPKRKIKNAN